MRSRSGGYFGVAVGYSGWVIGLAVVCGVVDGGEALFPVLIPSLLLSLGGALFTILVMEFVISSLGVASSYFHIALWGSLLFFGGVVTLILNEWIAPRVEENQALLEKIMALGGGSGLRVNPLFPSLLMGGGAFLLLLVTLKLVRAGDTSTDGG